MSNKIPSDQGPKKSEPTSSGADTKAVTKASAGDAPKPAKTKQPRGAAKKVAAAVKSTKTVDPSPVPAGKKATKPSPKVRPQLVRDSFTMPEADFAFIATLKSRALDSRRAAKKSELLRAGLRLLATLDSKALVAALDQLEPVKTGRPRKGH
jgi:hypothetical protein